MDDRDLAIRNLTYALFADRGRAPTAADVAAAAVVSVDDVRTAWVRLHEAHAIVLEATTGELVMANPFSAAPTAFRVRATGGWWYANCAWDAFGVCAALHVDGEIETSCADCGEAIACAVRSERPDNESLVFHCLVPAARWWDDIVFT